MGYSAPLTAMQIELIRHADEADFQNNSVLPMAAFGGFETHHTTDSRRDVGGGRMVGDSQAKGYPDLTLAHPEHGLIFAELKRQDGWRWRPGQRQWLDTLASISGMICDWAAAALAVPGFPADLLGPHPKVYAAFWQPGDVAMIEDVLVHHRFETATWWPDSDPGR